MNKDLSVPFDQYQRYGVAAVAIESIRRDKEPLNILEVGANVHRILGKLLPNDRIVYLDREIPTEMQSDSDIILGDATDLRMADESFDVVVGLDVFEHIPNELRESFLRETSRISKHFTIIGAPFNRSEVILAENEASNYWKNLFTFPYRWLEEHSKSGLPDLEWSHKTLSRLGYSVHELSHGDLVLWTALTKAHFAKEYVNGLKPLIGLYDNFYKDYLFENDFNPTQAYRHFLFSSRDTGVISKIKERFAKIEKNSRESLSAFDDLALKVLDLIPQIASEMNEHVNKMEAQIADKDAQIYSLLNSASWKITKPIRDFKKILIKLVGF